METEESGSAGVAAETKRSVLLHEPLLAEEKPFGCFPFELCKHSFKNQAHCKISKASRFVQ